MDLNDSFTEKLLQRNQARKQFKTIKESEILDIGRKRQALVEDNQNIDEGNTSDIPEESPKRPFEGLDDSSKRLCILSPSKRWPPLECKYGKENTPVEKTTQETFVPFKAAVKGLAALRKKDDQGSSAINNGVPHQAEVNTHQTYVFSTNSTELCAGRKTRLANLAANINQWEDNLHKPILSTNNFAKLSELKNSNKSSASYLSNSPHHLEPELTYHTNPIHKNEFGKGNLDSSVKLHQQSPSKKDNLKGGRSDKKSFNLRVWDKAIEATLDSGVEKKSCALSSLIDEKREYLKKEESVHSNQSSSVHSIKNKFLLNQHESVDLNKSFEPTELPLSARRALFEQGIQGKVGKANLHSVEPKLSVAQRAALFENTSQSSSASKSVPSYRSKNICPPKSSPCKSSKINEINTGITSSPSKMLSTPEKTVSESISVGLSPVKKINTDTQAVEKMLLARINSKVDVKESSVEPLENRAKNKSGLVNYWEKLSASSKSGNSLSDEEKNEMCESEMCESEMCESEDEQGYESETESKHERESELEFNYNTEATEDYCESDNDSDSLTNENVFKSPAAFPPLRATASSAYHHTNKSMHLNLFKASAAEEYESSSQEDTNVEASYDASSLSDGCSYAESTVSTDVRSSGPPQSYSSSCSSVGSSYDPESSKESEENFKNSLGSNPHTPLLYTVSFYRKQKQETRTPPLKTIIRREQVATPPINNQAESIQEQIKIYQEEIMRQQIIIGQTSQALNLCHATAEFSGSSEQVEGERLLLIATQKRQALLNEIQRLKAHGAEGARVSDGTGTLTITDLQLPLKQEFLAAQLEGRINDAVHWFLCLIRYGAQVIVTQMVSTDDKLSNGALCFTNHIKLQNLPPDFSIVFEVYALQTKKESLPHEKKYHIKRDKSTMKITSKGKKSDIKLTQPAITSPGGPNAVRSPSFGVIGFTRFTIQNCNKKCYTLDKVPFSSPLDGVLRVQLHLHAEHKVVEKGFLTMFEDVSGFGAWHRRWCVLNAQRLTYWKYPDDEHKKEPIGAIDLKQCVTAVVKPVSRDVCARSHTFELVTVRPQKEGDKNTLISQCTGTILTTKHLLSADTKEERILWCDKLNEALSNVRKWDPHALRPVETSL